MVMIVTNLTDDVTRPSRLSLASIIFQSAFHQLVVSFVRLE